MLAQKKMSTAHFNYNRYTSTILLQSLLSNLRSLGAFRSAVCSFIDSSQINSSSHGVCVSSTSRTWSSKRSSILPRCLSKRRMDAMFLYLTRCKRDCKKPMMNKGKSYGLMRPCSPSHPMRNMSGVGANTTSPYHVSHSVQSTRLFLQQSVKGTVSSASHYMKKQ